MKIKKAVFPAAGMGTRFLPATKAIPKEMLPLIDKPLIQYTIEEARASGLEDVIMVTGMGKSAIKDHFDTSIELELHLKNKGKKETLRMINEISDLVNYTYTRQKNPRGLGHAILCAEKIVGNEPFAVFLGDDIIDSKVPAMKQLLDVHDRYGCSVIAVQRVPRRETHMYGIIKAKRVAPRLHKILDMVEKPKKNPPSNLAIIGRYILTPEIFAVLGKTSAGSGGEIQLTDAIKTLLKSQDVYAYEFEGDRYDAGDKLGFLKANVALALKRKDIKDEFKKFIRGLKL